MDLFDLYQQKRIWDAEAKADNAGRDAAHASERVATEVRRLEAKIDGLALICEALWELLRERTQLTDDDIRKKMQEIDLRDGVADGKITSVATECRKCQRKTFTRNPVCMYCGEPVTGVWR
ncbi:MAG: hypothetical protein JNK75_05765 [Betaproteobacteria bacterium]|nr:hypothetical protein [Betaproteobacteria bacterium]